MFEWHEIVRLVLFAAEEPAQEGFLISLMRSPMAPILMIGLMLYTMLLLPERRKRAETQKMLDNLKKNDKIATIGGILGVVVSADKDEVVLRIDEANNTRIRIRRSAVQSVLESDSGKSES